MSLIQTYKCDGCGAITRAYPDEWFQLHVERMSVNSRRNVLDIMARRESVKRHVCSAGCAARALSNAAEQIEALEVPT